MDRRRIGGIAAMLALSVGAGTGCGAPDRSEDAKLLEAALVGMPGVASAHVGHENALGRGASLNVDVAIPAATRQQIVDVVDRINAVRGDRFDRYNQAISFYPAASRSVDQRCGSTLDSAGIADQAIALRLLASRITAQSIDASCSRGKLTIQFEQTAVNEVLAVLREAGYDMSGSSVDINAAGSAGPISTLAIHFPFSDADWTRFQALVGRLPATPWLAGVGPGAAIGGLGVTVRSPATAQEQLSGVIAAVGADKDHPLSLSWGLDNPPPAKAGVPAFTGSVDVGGCSYADPQYGNSRTDLEMHPEKYLTPEALTVQRAMRVRYDNCAK